MERTVHDDGIEQSETFRAFADVVRYCAANGELVSEFNRLTGHKLFQARTPIEIAIDNACQHDPDAEGMPDFLQFVWDCIFVPWIGGRGNEIA